MKPVIFATAVLTAITYSQRSLAQGRHAPHVEIQSLHIVPTRIPTVVEVRGEAVNVRPVKLRTALIKLKLLDDAKIKVGEAQAFGLNIEPGQSWSFVSKGFLGRASAAGVEVVDITAH